jgi:general stress protein 26
MATDLNDKQAVEARLWEEIKKTRFGMLGLTGEPARHFQPMTAFAEPESGQIWFFTRSSTDVARDAQDRHDAMYVVQATDNDFQACIGGHLEVRRDRARIEKYWNPMVAAWFPDGKDDPSLTLLCLDCSDAQLWISQGGALKYLFETAKANLTHTTPDVGGRANLDLN